MFIVSFGLVFWLFDVSGLLEILGIGCFLLREEDDIMIGEVVLILGLRKALVIFDRLLAVIKELIGLFLVFEQLIVVKVLSQFVD